MSYVRLITVNVMMTLLLAMSLSACAPIKTPTELTSHDRAVDASLTEITATVIPPLETPKVTPTSKPVVKNTPGNHEQNGLILLAMRVGGYSQLFAYHPVSLPLTQLTMDTWNHADPAISPDGTKLAFCADEAGRWDIYILDLVSGENSRLTETASYACSPTWSPDGRWMAFEEVLDGKLNLLIRSVVDESTAPVRLTDNGGNNFDPAWSPGGREIAFVTDRNGRLEIWLTNLDNPDQRFIPVIRSAYADYASPAWSQDGSSLTWKKSDEFEEIETLGLGVEHSSPVTLGSGSLPEWMDNTEGVLAVVRSANTNDLVAYAGDPTRLLIPPLHLPNEVTSLSWVSNTSAAALKEYAASRLPPDTILLWQVELTTQDTGSGRYEMVHLPDVTAPEPYLIDTVNESFSSLRTALAAELGWDFLKILDNASISLPMNPSPDMEEDWGYTGRAIAVNMDPFDSGWMVVNREDILGRTYWRVWLKCKEQDGTCGVAMHPPIWDFDSRITGDAAAYENGGKTTVLPQGYWVDFTAFAREYGWERLPAGSNWRGFFPDTQINTFVLSDGLAWQDAMRQRYSIETIEEYWPTP